ncbi:MAG: hypothetical protein KGN76_01420 [Acidobacteriota bacterium]|nr:hypothetical protein [Acidobacteriota bacterium]
MKRLVTAIITVTAALAFSSAALLAAEPAAASSLHAGVSAAALQRFAQQPLYVPPSMSAVRHSRPAALVPLYISLGALEAVDTATTFRGLNQGASEANPVMRGLMGHGAAVIGVKAAVTATSIWAAERMWRHNRVGAVVLMLAVNGVMAAVVGHNAGVLGR